MLPAARAFVHSSQVLSPSPSLAMMLLLCLLCACCADSRGRTERAEVAGDKSKPAGMSRSVGRFESRVPAVLTSGGMFEQSSGQALPVVKALWDTELVCSFHPCHGFQWASSSVSI